MTMVILTIEWGTTEDPEIVFESAEDPEIVFEIDELCHPADLDPLF